MNLVILGATGRTGLLLVRQALDAGHHVTAYVRKNGDLPAHPDLTVMLGPLGDAAAMTAAFTGADAVVSCLGPAATPAVAFQRHTLMTDTLPVVLSSMGTAGVGKLVVLSALGVGGSARKTSAVARLAYATFTRTVYADKVIAERPLATTAVDWTLVYPGVLTDKAPKRPATARDLAEITTIPGLPRVPRSEVARVLLEAATTATWSRRTVAVI
jgi:putative NADH-flavin reductase